MMSPPPPRNLTDSDAQLAVREVRVAQDQATDQVQGQSDSQTQSQTQSTQQASQEHPVDYTDLWGYLVPLNQATAARIEFKRETPEITVGRKPTSSVVLNSKIISIQHCKIVWDEKDRKDSAVLVTDLSSNGTFINSAKLGKGRFALLHEGDEIAFGKCGPSSDGEDFRYIYRHTASGRPVTGLHAFYDVNEELGRGTFARVVRAVHRATGLWYAVKVIEMTKMKDPKAVEREVAILKSLRHDHVCGMEEVFVDDLNTYIVMEYISGGDLLEHILSYPAGIPEPEAQDLTYQLCEAMTYIHSQGVLHRDLKPENILLTSDNPPVLKIVDFGLSKAVNDETMAKSFLGTPWYLAPEVAQLDGYDDRADSYSVGAIVFSMLTRERAHDDGCSSDTAPDWRAKIAQRQVQWTLLDEDVNGCPRPISELAKDFTVNCLQPRPEERMRLCEARYHPWLLPLTQERDPACATRGGRAVLQTTQPGSQSQPDSSGELSRIIEASLAAGAHPQPDSRQMSVESVERVLGLAPERESPCIDVWTVRSRAQSPASTLAHTLDGSDSQDDSDGASHLITPVESALAPLHDRHNVSAAERHLQNIVLSQRAPKRKLSVLDKSGSFEDMPVSEEVNPRLRAVRGRRRDAGAVSAAQVKRGRYAAAAVVGVAAR